MWIHVMPSIMVTACTAEVVINNPNNAERKSMHDSPLFFSLGGKERSNKNPVEAMTIFMNKDNLSIASIEEKMNLSSHPYITTAATIEAKTPVRQNGNAI